MKKILIAALIVGTSPAIAGEVTIKVPDTFGATMKDTHAAFERCIGEITIGGSDKSMCAAVANVLNQLSSLPTTPTVAPSPTPSPSPTP